MVIKPDSENAFPNSMTMCWYAVGRMVYELVGAIKMKFGHFASNTRTFPGLRMAQVSFFHPFYKSVIWICVDFLQTANAINNWSDTAS